MKSIINFFILFVFLSSLTDLVAQQSKDYIFGVVLEKKTQKPIPFATIRLKEKAIGVVTNQDGGFRFPHHFMTEEKILEVSCLGFKTKEIYLSDLNLDIQNKIEMIPEPTQLNEIVLVGKRKSPPSPIKIIGRAIKSIPQNYAFSPFSYVGYYRDYQLKDNTYINLNEALLNIVDKGFVTNDFDSTKIQIYDYKENISFKRDTLAIKPYNYTSKEKIIKNAYLYGYGGNEVSILRIHDAIRNYNVNTYSFINVPEKGIIENHSLLRLKDQSFNGERMFVISLKKKNDNSVKLGLSNETAPSRFLAEGKIYISQSTYAIHKLEYQLFDTKEKKNPKDSKNLLFEVLVEYKKHNNKMYLNYISFHNVFTVQKSLFNINEIIIDDKNNCFDIRFNKPPIRLIDWTEKNFKLRFKKRKIKIKEIKSTNKGYLLYPSSEDFDEITKELTNLYGDTHYFSPDILEFNFVNLIDANRNKINSFYKEEYNQYREFFTQQIKEQPDTDIANHSLMKKETPIFSNQPIVRPIDFDKYWMNTPLISKE